MENQNHENNDLHTNLEKTNILLKQYLKSIAWYRMFGRGILAGLGGTVGLAILLWFVVYIMNKLQYLPYMGNFIENFNTLLHSRPTF